MCTFEGYCCFTSELEKLAFNVGTAAHYKRAALIVSAANFKSLHDPSVFFKLLLFGRVRAPNIVECLSWYDFEEPLD